MPAEPRSEPRSDIRSILVVPCFDEAARLDEAALVGLVDGEFPVTHLLLVDDGSRDQTRACLDRVARRAPPGRVGVMALPTNQGKAEAVRQGLLRALEQGADVVGYFDADLSTPVAEIRRLLDRLRHSPTTDVLIGARIVLLGSDVERSAVRHYLGRIFGTVASLMLQARVYDTQCGAKLFRRSPALLAALGEPFLSRWSFDVELLGRLLVGTPSIAPLDRARFLEVPLQIWHDVPGSKLRPAAMAGALKELALIGMDLRRRRREARGR
jgi:dolichyl-phosphate beta-glucosyltransferase